MCVCFDEILQKIAITITTTNPLLVSQSSLTAKKYVCSFVENEPKQK